MTNQPTLKFSVFFLSLLFTSSAFAGIICPSDKTIKCYDDLHDLSSLGEAYGTGNHQWHNVYFIDQNFLNQCDVGYILRQWYVDYDSNGSYNSDEPTCTQRIDITYNPVDITFVWPNDIDLTCNDDIPYSAPSFYGHPCDAFGIEYTDHYFEFSPDACLKVLRKFTVINWCTYAPNDPNWNGEGIWEHTQVIKIIDDEKPVFTSCDDLTVGLDKNCETELTITSSAEDLGDCPSGKLRWSADIDLWGDGTIDLSYGYYESGRFFIPELNSGEEVSITLEDKVGPGKHKVHWRVQDKCHNTAECHYVVETLDLKPPTPYCLRTKSVSFDASDGHVLEVPAKYFDIGSFDNCDPEEKLSFSFSEDPEDDVLEVVCSDQGMLTLNVYAIDKNGNSDFCEVILLVKSNENCDTRFSPSGQTFSLYGGEPLPDVMLNTYNSESMVQSVVSDQSGMIQALDLPISEEVYFEYSYSNSSDSHINVKDLLLLKDYLLQAQELSPLQLLLADLNKDGLVTARDLVELRARLLGVHSDNEYIAINYSDTQATDISTFGLEDFRGDLDAYIGQVGDLVQDDVENIVTADLEDLTYLVSEGEELVLVHLTDVVKSDFGFDLGSQSEVIFSNNGDARALVSKDHALGMIARLGENIELLSMVEESGVLLKVKVQNRVEESILEGRAYRIFDTQGRLLMNLNGKSLMSNPAELGLPSGLYIVESSTSKDEFKMIKVVIP